MRFHGPNSLPCSTIKARPHQHIPIPPPDTCTTLPTPYLRCQRRPKIPCRLQRRCRTRAPSQSTTAPAPDPHLLYSGALHQPRCNDARPDQQSGASSRMQLLVRWRLGLLLRSARPHHRTPAQNAPPGTQHQQPAAVAAAAPSPPHSSQRREAGSRSSNMRSTPAAAHAGTGNRVSGTVRSCSSRVGVGGSGGLTMAAWAAR